VCAEEDKQPTKDDIEKAKDELMKLFTNQKEEMEKTLAQTKDKRVSSMEKSKETISKHVGEKAFISAKQKESMAKTPSKLLDGELGNIVDKLNKEIGLKSFLSASQKEKVEQLKRIVISPEAFKGIQEQIDSTIARKAMSDEGREREAGKVGRHPEQGDHGREEEGRGRDARRQG
jgi:hypothetical protein